jgi:RHS repeat-associated protein
MKRYLISIIAAMLLPACGLAQTGLPPFGSLDHIGLEVRNNQDLNVLLAIPIMSSPGRGINLNLSLVYNSSIWANAGIIWLPTANNSSWGWTTAFGTGYTTYNYSTSQRVCNHNLGDVTYIYTTTYQNYNYIDALGTTHPLGLFWQEVENDCLGTDVTSGTFTSYANDGSGYLASISSADPVDVGILSSGGISLGASRLTDTNGNYISSATNGSETDWTDSAGRLALKTITGTSTMTYQYLDPTGAYQTTTLNLQTLNIKTNFQCSGVTEYTGTASLPSTLVLPNSQTYTFTYEPSPGNSGYYTGRLQRVALPTGGYYEYDYPGAHDSINCTDGTTLSMNRVVSDGTTSATWNYVRNTSNLTTTITTPQLADTPQANDMVVAFNSSGQEISRKIYANSPGSGTPLRTINTTWATNGTPATQVTILEDGTTQSEVATTYDSNGLLDSVSEYNLGSGAPGSLFRTTTYTYQTSTNYTSRNILNLVTSKQVKDGSGTVQYRQDSTYDGVALLSANCPTGALQHGDAGYPCSFNYRGNPTMIQTYLSPATQGNPVIKNFTYDWFGNLRTAQVNCCQNKTWAYSSATQYSQPDSVTSGSSPSLQSTFQYNAYTGQVTSSTDPNALISNISYDYLRRPTQILQKVGSTQVGGTISYAYDDIHFTSTTTATIDSAKSVQEISALDSLGRPYLSTAEDINNNVISKANVQYDLAGRAYKTSNPYITGSPSYWTTTAFDVLGRPTSVTLPDNSATSYSYTTNTATVTDPKGIKRESVADGAGRLATIWEPDPNNSNNLTLQTSYAYNLLNELTQITQGSQTRTYVYDALGRLNSATTPEAGMVCFGTLSGSTCQSNGYDSFDNLLYRTDARGVLTSYGYDGLNRLTSVSYTTTGTTATATSTLGLAYGNDSSCTSAHGAGCIGQLITITDGVGSENYTYNNLEELTQLQKVINSSTYTTTYAYNLAGQLTQLTYPSGRVVQQSVDAAGRLCEVAPSTTGCGTAASPFATGLGYSAAGQITGLKYGNGIYASFGFSSDRLQLNCLDYSTTNRNGNCTHDGTTKFGLSYSYPSAPSNNGLISGITDSVDNGRTASYTYDSLYRLVTAQSVGSANYPAWGLSETYDRYGNRSAQTAIPGAGCVAITCPQPSFAVNASTNRLIGPPYAYDLSGNMTNDGINTLAYDAENHVTSATNGSSSGTYTYDANGQRVKKVSGGTTIVTIFFGGQVLAEYNNGAAPSSPTNEYIYAGNLRVASIQSGTTNYWHNDHLSPRVRTDTSGNVSDQRGTFPFGETWYSPGASPYMFTAYYRDYEAAGNDYAQARSYVGGLGRFSSPDLVAGSTSDPQSLNRYSYVRNMPVMLTDPFGTCPGGFAQNRDIDQLQDSKTGGPSDAGSNDEGDPQIGMGSHPPSGPCNGFTDQGGGGGVGNDPFFGPDGGSIYNQPIIGGGGSIGDGGLGFIFGPGGGGGMGPNPLDDLLFGPQDPCGTFVDEGIGNAVMMGACGGAGQAAALGDALSQAVRRAMDRLFKEECAKVFNTMNPAIALENAFNDNKIRAVPFGDDIKPGVGAQTNQGMGVIYLASNRYFFTGQFNDGPVTRTTKEFRDLTQDQVQEVMLIHEMLHLTGGVGDDDKNQQITLGNAQTVNGSAGVTAAVIQHCIHGNPNYPPGNPK